MSDCFTYTLRLYYDLSFSHLRYNTCYNRYTQQSESPYVCWWESSTFPPPDYNPNFLNVKNTLNLNDQYFTFNHTINFLIIIFNFVVRTGIEPVRNWVNFIRVTAYHLRLPFRHLTPFTNLCLSGLLVCTFTINPFFDLLKNPILAYLTASIGKYYKTTHPSRLG